MEIIFILHLSGKRKINFMKKLLFFILVCFSITTIHSQNIKLIQATMQHWAAGACCSHGTNYVFEIEFPDSVSNIIIDSIRIGQQYFSKNSQINFTTNTYKTKGKKRIQIYVNEGNSGDGVQKLDSEVEPIIKYKNFKNLACIKYRFNGNRELFYVNKLESLQTPALP